MLALTQKPLLASSLSVTITGSSHGVIWPHFLCESGLWCADRTSPFSPLQSGSWKRAGTQESVEWWGLTAMELWWPWVNRAGTVDGGVCRFVCECVCGETPTVWFPICLSVCLWVAAHVWLHIDVCLCGFPAVLCGNVCVCVCQRR